MHHLTVVYPPTRDTVAAWLVRERYHRHHILRSENILQTKTGTGPEKNLHLQRAGKRNKINPSSCHFFSAGFSSLLQTWIYYGQIKYSFFLALPSSWEADVVKSHNLSFSFLASNLQLTGKRLTSTAGLQRWLQHWVSFVFRFASPVDPAGGQSGPC